MKQGAFTDFLKHAEKRRNGKDSAVENFDGSSLMMQCQFMNVLTECLEGPRPCIVHSKKAVFRHRNELFHSILLNSPMLQNPATNIFAATSKHVRI